MSIDDYANFDLLVLPAGENGYQARVTQTAVGQATHAFTRDDLRRLLRVRMEVDYDHVAAEKWQQDQVWELAC